MLRPKEPSDLLLAPVAVEVDERLDALRDLDQRSIVARLELELDTPERLARTPAARAARVLEFAVRNVDLHGWRASITDDLFRLRLEDADYHLDLGFSPTLVAYLKAG